MEYGEFAPPDEQPDPRLVAPVNEAAVPPLMLSIGRIAVSLQTNTHHSGPRMASGTLGYIAVFSAVSLTWAVFLYSVLRSQ